MSKRRRKKKNQLASQYQPNYKLPKPVQIAPGVTDYSFLNDMIACNGCGSAFMPKANGLSDDDLIQLYVNNLPTLPYVVDQLLNFIFSNGLTTGDENLDETVLKPFLFAHNVKGVTNYSVLREGIREAMIWGKCGLRWLSEEDGLICMPHTQYTSVIARDGEYLGFDKTVFYIASTDPSLPVQVGPEPIKFDEQEFIQNHHLVSDDGRIFVIQPDEFTNLRNDTTIENGTSRLMKDRQRLYLLEQIYERLNYDIKYDGPGRLIFWTKDGFMSGEVEMGAGEILNQSPEAIDSRKEKAKREVKELLEQIKGSSSDNIIAVSSMFEKMDHLPRVTKATEFLEYLTMKEGSIIAQCFGIVPELIGLGDVSGNVSMEKIIDNAMTNTIVPMREAFATQLSPMISSKLGIPKIYFDKYELKQFLDKSAQAYKMALTLNQVVGGLVNGNENLEDNEKNAMKELIPDICKSMKQYI
ncbi:hypothetical protein AAK706_04445 [Erysipelotrichaceae bacterium 66-17]